MALFGLFKDKTIEDYVNKLPEKGLTVHCLNALDFLAPGEWENHHNFDLLLKKVAADDDAEYLASVKKRALALWADENQGYQKGLDIYERVDTADALLGTAALANKLGEKVKLLSFLEKLTPGNETSQTIDLALKVISELLAFVKINGIPGEGISDFVQALGEYTGAAKIRMAGIIAFDGIIPLGPDFLKKCMDSVGGLNEDTLGKSKIFQSVKPFMPGQGKESVDFIQRGFGATSGWIDGFVKGNQITQEGISGRLKGFIDFSDDKLDYLGALLDVGTNYFKHTGTQSLAISLIKRAASEV